MFSTNPLFALFASVLAVSVQATPQSTAPSTTTVQPTGTVIKIIAPGSDQQPLVGSIIGVDSSSATTLAVACPSGTDSSDCGMPNDGLTVTQGPATAVMSTTFAQESDPVVVTYGWECSLGGTTTAECTYRNEATITASAPASLLAEFNGSTIVTSKETMTLAASDLSTALMQVTITAGAEKLTQKPTPTGAATTASGTGTAAAASGTGAATQLKMGGLAIGGALMAVLVL